MGNDMEVLGGVLAAMVGLFVFILIITVVVGIVTLISYWFIVKKMGEPGWKGIIPYYNMYVMYEKVWNTKMFFVWLGITLASSALSGAVSASMQSDSNAMTIISLLSTGISIASFVINIMFYYNLSKAFGKGVGFTIGLILLPVIFFPMLAFGKAQYVGNTSNGSATPEMYTSDYQNNMQNNYGYSNNNSQYTPDNSAYNNPYDNQGMDGISPNHNDDNNNQF